MRHAPVKNRLERIRGPGLATSDTGIREAFINLVGAETYQTWLMMMRRLVPEGRTHRLCVVVASFIQYASQCRHDEDLGDENAIIKAINEVQEQGPESSQLLQIVEFLFHDAGVAFEKTNRNGQGYSIAEQAASEFWRWDFMPWE